jgi:hypothetical protein
MQAGALETSGRNSLKTFVPATWTGLVLVVLFLGLLQSDTCAVHGWLMLPVAAAAGGTRPASGSWRR